MKSGYRFKDDELDIPTRSHQT